MRHHTKQKADIGVAQVIADLYRQGFGVAIPMSEHAPFDLVAYDDSRLYRLQVKYARLRNGRVTGKLRRSWADKDGSHSSKYEVGSFDYLAIYCPETDSCYYIPFKEIAGMTTVDIRVLPSKNKQVKGIRLAKDYIRLGSSETVRAAPEIGEDTVQTTTEQGLGNQEW
jgi:hypothetical protein